MKRSELAGIVREEVRKYLIEEDVPEEGVDDIEHTEEMTGDPEDLAREMVGDGELPNKYWVYKDSQWLTNRNNESNEFNWSGEVYDDVPDKSEFLGMFDTFAEALSVAEDQYLPSPEDELDDFHNVYIEDRLSGIIFDGVWHESVEKHDSRFKKGEISEFWFEWNDDTKYTKETMEKAGETFE